jgi:creatinine amidohydrolase
MFPDELEAAFAECPVVYYPYGLCEPHGPHCTVGLDALKARAIAIQAAEAYGGIVAPTDYWHIHEIGGYAVWAAEAVGEVERKWTTSVPPWVHFRNVCYHVRNADQIGFHAAIFLTGHYGPNWEDLKTLITLIQPMTNTQLYALPDWEANVPGFDFDGKSGGDHAGKVETSLLAALEPDCVDLSRMPGRFEPAPEAAYLAKPPHFAMGPTAAESSRLEGERMVADEVVWLGEKAGELLAAYDEAADRPGFPTFESVERFWEKTVKPTMKDWKTMQPDFGRGGEVDPSSVWHANKSVYFPE